MTKWAECVQLDTLAEGGDAAGAGKAGKRGRDEDAGEKEVASKRLKPADAGV
jgi:hypothetical protein